MCKDKTNRLEVESDEVDFQTMRPPHLLVGLLTIMLQLVIVGLSMASAMLGYSWLSFEVGFACLMISGVIAGIPSFLVVTGRPKAVRGVQTTAIVYALLAAPLIGADVGIVVVITLILTALLLYLTFSLKYWMFVTFYKVIWERHRERLARSKS